VGVYYLGITGGEPLLRHDLEEIISSADQRSVLALATSGFSLTLERARRLKEAGLFYMLVSLDHRRLRRHDKLRGFDGAYKAAIDAMRYSKEAGLYTILQVAVTKKFVTERDGKEIWKLARLGKKVGVQEIRCRGVVPAGRLVKNRAELLTEKDCQSLMQSANEINSQPDDYPKVSLFEEFEDPTRLGCNAGGMHVYVDCSGNLCPCDYVPLSFGNLDEDPFDSVWSDMRAVLDSPRKKCLALSVADDIAAYDGKLPLPVKLSREICQRHRTSELPGIYS
jgi:MoaA/NifB/PqqE/SkfB family radical SAM enzyme